MSRQPCDCGGRARFRCVQPKWVLTTVGELRVSRRYFACDGCRAKMVPMDSWAGIGPRMLSEHTRRVVAVAGSSFSFDQASAKLLELCHLRISDDTIERVCQEEGQRCGRWMMQDPATGQMLEKAPGELEFSTDGVKINTVNGWSELRLNILAKRVAAPPATPQQWNDRVLSEPGVRLAWNAIANCEQVGRSWKRMLRHLKIKADAELSVVADGARWIWDQAARHLPTANAQWVVDIYHVSQHLHDCGKTLLGEGEAARQWAEQKRMQLIESGGPALVASLNQAIAAATAPAAAKALSKLRNYLRENQDSLWYRQRLAEGKTIGSGMIEGGCKTIVGQRLKRNSARWVPRRAERIANLRCLQYSGCWDLYWNQRAA